MFEIEPIIDIFDLDLTTLGGTIERFHPYETEQPIAYLTNNYNPISIQVEGFEITSKGLPNPRITVGNVLGIIGGLIANFDGLQGAKLTRTKLQSHAPPHTYISTDVIGIPDIYIVDRATNETSLSVTFELRSIFDLSGMKLPRRTILQNTCPLVYKSAECGYIGSLATCDRTIPACLTHFQQMTGQTNPELNFGGFPGVDRYPN